MPRKRKQRKVGFQPEVTYFKPRGVLLSDLKEIKLTLDEIEALRLADLEAMGQIKAAKKMGISQSTFQRILSQARRKTARALVKGMAVKMEGGEVTMARGRGFGAGRGSSAGGGRGRMGGGFAAGPGGICVCTNPDCRNEAGHQAGVPCYQVKCPKCGSPMVRKRG